MPQKTGRNARPTSRPHATRSWLWLLQAGPRSFARTGVRKVPLQTKAARSQEQGRRT